ncbi:restriction endonuclease subunit S [Candidatus Clostridium helianthi]|uniref:Restriction endonuclease subunit S n=1 Tax=Candidatus Clostridium helianthi TaxID=3381660 RepID=A0ABW8S4E5_9CLOT
MAKKNLTLEEKLEDAIVKDMPYEVPKSWMWVVLGNCINIRRGASPRPINNFITKDVNGVNWIKIGDTDGSRFLKTTEQKITLEGAKKSVYLKAGTLILSNSMSFGRPYILKTDGCIHDGWLALSNYESLFNINYLYYGLLSSDWYFEQVAVGSGVRNLNIDRVSKLPIPLPPLKEQQRIVDRIESLFGKLDKSKELIEEARAGFEKRKSAVLEKAFRGELTEKWRCKHKVLENNLLMDIADYYINKLSKSDFIKIQELQDIAKKEDNGLESKWIKCTIGAVGKVGNGSTPSRKIEEYWNGDIPWVSSGEVRNNRITFTKENITKEGFENSSVKLLNKGSVLMAMIGEGKTRGQSSILDIEATTNQNIAAIDLSHGCVLSEFMWHWLQFNYKKNRDGGNGTGPKALNCQKVRELDFILPPLDEQKEIVKILDKLLEEESKIEEFTQLEDQIELIKKSILAKAFRGGLGTNCEEDESALELMRKVLSK